MKASLYASSAGLLTAVVLGSAGPAWAQNATSAQVEGSSTQAQSAAESNDDAIVVTARRREELLQDVPISITVFSQEQLDRRNIVVAADLATYTPSLSVNQRYGPEKSSFAIRGFNQDQSTAPTVGVYFADVVGVRAQGGTTSGNTVGAGAFMDLQNVQVLKGPQGTLFGRNTTGGAVLLVPRKPTDRFEGYVDFSAGKYNLLRIQGALNVPITENVRARFAIDRNSRDGYMRNQSGIGPDDYNNVDYFAARASLVIDLASNLENYTIASFSNSFGNGYAGPIVACNRALNSGDPLFNLAAASNPANGRAILTAGPACDQIARANARGDSLLDVDVANPNPFIKLKQWQIINTTTWQVSDSFRIKNIASYGQFHERASFSLYGDNFFVKPLPELLPRNTGNAFAGRPFSYILLNPAGDDDNAAQSTFTEELQFQGNLGGDRFNWQAGAYYEMSKPLGWSHGYTAQSVSCTNLQAFECYGPFGNGNFSDSKTKLTFRNIGFYAQGTFNITSQLALTAGFRYTIDKITGQNESTRININTTGQITGRVCNDSFRFNVPDGPDPDAFPDAKPVLDGSECHFEIVEKSQKPTWLIDLDYKPTDDILLYAKYARGYRQGGLSFTNVSRETWDPEKVDAYEIGAKTSFRFGSARGYFNIAAFYNDFSNQQVFAGAIANPVSGIAGGAVILNAGKSRIKGVEVDTSVTLFDSLRLDVGYTYLNTLIKEIDPPVATFPFLLFQLQAVEGSPLVLSPKHRLTATATYTLPLREELGEISVGATYVYTAKQLSNSAVLNVAPDPLSPYDAPNIGIIPATHLINLNLDWKRVMGGPVDAALFVTNLTNKIYPLQFGGGYTSAGFDSAIIAQPRMWGFRLRYNFGD